MALNLKGGIALKQYRNSILKELVRKSIHMCSSFVPFFLGIAYEPVIVLLCALLVFYCVSELLRLKGVELPVVAKITAVAARKRDENKFVLGPVTLVIGIVMSALLWNLPAASIGIYALAFGDGLASLCGKLFGRIYIPFTHGKTAAGSLTCFFAVFVSSFCVCRNAAVSFFLALAAMIIEVIPMADLDNVFIPVVICALAQFFQRCI